ncbi:hypothetical protein [Methylobacterium indicum]|uniref:hypothetical protein n=1 Tax=Methylobacterium indicum TaxID=1775910 RepID=UPI000B2A8EEC|nr:hypothetical protein [Methylobacterium indicum]
MATLPTPAEKGRMILDIYQHFNSKAGHALRGNNFIAVATQFNASSDDIADGLEYAYSQGWVEDGPNDSVRLTDAGFAAM